MTNEYDTRNALIAVRATPTVTQHMPEFHCTSFQGPDVWAYHHGQGLTGVIIA